MPTNLNNDKESSENLNLSHSLPLTHVDANQIMVQSNIQNSRTNQPSSQFISFDSEKRVKKVNPFCSPSSPEHARKAKIYANWSVVLLIAALLLSVSFFSAIPLISVFSIPTNIAGIIAGIRAKQYGQWTFLPLFHIINLTLFSIYLLFQLFPFLYLMML